MLYDNKKGKNRMLNKIKYYLAASLTTLTMAGAVVLAPSMASATTNCGNIATSINSGVASTGSNVTCGTGKTVSTGVQSIAKQVVEVFSVVVGVVSVIMIIYSGFRYITSGGDQNGVGSAKNTLVFAIIGLIIVALAQVIVHVVLNSSQAAVNA